MIIANQVQPDFVIINDSLLLFNDSLNFALQKQKYNFSTYSASVGTAM